MGKKAALIINPASGKAVRANLNRFADIATGLGFGLDVLRTSHAGHATALAREASGEGYDLVIAAGGDGTINEAINGLMGTDTPLGIVPLGTANVLAREAALPLKPEEALKTALTLEPRPIALGLIKTADESRYFSLMIGAGFDASVVHDLNNTLKSYIGKAAYVLKALETLLRWDSPRITLSIDGHEHACHTAIICNARKYGGEFVLAPEAGLARHGFEVIMLTRPGRSAMLRLALGFATGRHLKLGCVKTAHGTDITIEGGCHIQLDGDDLNQTPPARITSITNALRLAY